MTELPKAYEPTQVEPRWYEAWMKAGAFTADPSSPKPAYSIVLPPPNVTGSLHLGHALTATIQDILVRYKRMSGFEVLWLPGIDHAGIATQMVVERELLKTEKKTRQELGRAAFLEKVWAWKAQYGQRIAEQHRVLGASLDWTRERFTMDEGSSAAVREAFLKLHADGLIYRSYRLINWDPALQTALSDLEVDNEERQGSLWSIAYPVEGREERLVVATTRPETMLGDTAVAVHPEDPRYRHLIGSRVAVPLTGRTVPIIGDAELVSMEFGTGAVKVTPAHDFNDHATGLRHGLPMLNVLDEKGRINQAGGPYAGLDRFEARKKIVEDLTALGLLVEEKPHTVSLPLSQRSGVVVEPRLSRQWYLQVKGMAEKAVASVQSGQTRFVPAMWENVFFGWMNNIQDWCISRQLWWGHQIPAWYPRRPDGTVDWDTESPVVSAVKPPGEWEQDPDVLDTWFSSGLWPFSTLGWPDASSPDLRRFYPNAVMETGHDIIFFWVARMMMMGLHFLGEVPFRVVYLHAMVRDEKGEKMSKVKGNVIDPLDIIRGATADRLPAAVRNKFPQGMPPMGADALRFTLASLTQQGRDIKLSVERIAGYRAFANKLWNAARFALMNLGDFRDDGTVKLTDRPLSLADRWILSRLERTVVATRQALDGYQFGEAASGLYQFLWAELCDWYIELSKGALYEGDEAARTTARAVLVFVLDRVLRLLHPFMPFITEEIFEKLPIAGREASLCTAAYPQPQPGLLDEAAEATMAPLIQVIEAVRSIRGESNLSPALELTCQVQSDDAAVRETLSRHTHYIVPLAGLSSLTVGPVGPRPPQSAVELRGALEISVPLAGVIDLDEEKARLGKEVARSQAELAGLEKKFDNPSYAARAPAEVVEKDRSRIAELKARVVKLQQSIARLAAPSPAPDKKEG